jgi:hypothetical protein
VTTLGVPRALNLVRAFTAAPRARWRAVGSTWPRLLSWSRGVAVSLTMPLSPGAEGSSWPGLARLLGAPTTLSPSVTMAANPGIANDLRI